MTKDTVDKLASEQGKGKKEDTKKLGAPPKITPTGLWLAVKYLGLPLLAFLALLDLILYGVFRFGFDSCYGLLCLI